MSVAAVLAQQRRRVPELQVRRLRPGQRGVRGEQRPADDVSGFGRVAGQRRGLGHFVGVDVGTEQALHRGVDDLEAGREHLLRRGDVPHRGDRLGDVRRGEVVEGGDDDLARGRHPAERNGWRNSRASRPSRRGRRSARRPPARSRRECGSARARDALAGPKAGHRSCADHMTVPESGSISVGNTTFECTTVDNARSRKGD